MAPGILIDSPPSPAAAALAPATAATPAAAKHAAADAAKAAANGGAQGGEEQHGRGRGRLPVTLLSGFLGAGKTTLLEHILTSRDHGLRVGVIVNDVGSLNIDAALLANHGHDVTRRHEQIVAMQNGCICCTLRGDLLEEVARLAGGGGVDYLVIESSGVSEPMQVAETFSEEFAEMHIAAGHDLEGEIKDNKGRSSNDNDADMASNKRLAEILKAGGLSRVARLDTCVTMVDAVNFMSDFYTADFLADRQANRADLPDEDDRNISDLQVDQVEFADVVVINKCDLVPAAEVDRIRGVVAQLNPGAKILTTARARLDVAEILDTGAFSYEKAALAAGWLKSLREEVEPETEEYGIGTFVYRARRPFHPARLWNTIKNVFVVIQEEMVVVDEDGEEMTDAEEDDDDDDEDMEDVEGDDDDDEEEEQPQLDPKKRLAAKMAHGTFGPLLRSKGFLWLATRSRMFGEWSQAGVMLTIQGGDAWRCEMPEADLLSLDPASRAVVVGEIEKGGRWGDRRQELVFIGQKMGADGGRQRIQDAMDACLLDDEEFRAWERIMERGGDDVEERLAGLFEDGFEDWVEPDAHGHDHGHDHGEDGQCSL